MNVSQFEENIFEKVRILNETLWEYKADRKRITRWLENFQTDQERYHALFLLSQFMYFGNIQMRELLKGLYRDLFKYRVIEKIRLENNNSTDLNFINQQFEIKLRNTRFLGVGNPSESGAHLLYFFRQENSLPKSLFLDSSEIIDRYENQPPKLQFEDVKEYIFFDDFCGTGQQAKRYSDKIVTQIKAIDSTVEVSYLMLFATKKGKKFIKENTKFDYIEAVFELDESFECFKEQSRYFPGDIPDFISKDLAASLFGSIGYKMMQEFLRKEGYPPHLINENADLIKHGFGNCQLLIGFSHNTPDNTLPIFWWDEDQPDWYPIFKRYNKIYE